MDESPLAQLLTHARKAADARQAAAAAAHAVAAAAEPARPGNGQAHEQAASQNGQ